MKRMFLLILAVASVLALLCTGCENPAGNTGSNSDTKAVFTGLSADGSAETATTTKLTLTFDRDVEGLTAADITLNSNSTGAVKGVLTRIDTGEYRLAVTGITTAGEITVGVSKSGYTITPASKSVDVYYYYDPSTIAVAFTALSADGAVNETTTKLTLTFSENIEGLSENDIILTPNSTGAEKGALTHTGTTGVYELAVDNISAAGGITVSVFKEGYSITPQGIDVDVFYYAPPPPPVAVSFDNLIADGSATVTTGKLTLTFDKDIEELTEDDITLTPNDTGTVKGALTHTGTTGVYELTVTGITASGEISVAVSKSGYSITPASRNANMFYYSAPPPPVNAAFSGLSADGSAETAITTKLTLTFDRDIAGLTASDIILMSNIGAEKGELTSKGGGVYELSVSGINAEGEITVKVEKTGYDISPPNRNVNVHYTPPAGNLIITYTEITDKAPLITGPTLYRVSHGGPTGVTLIINNPERYDSNSISWTVQDTKVEGTGPEFTLSANNAAYNFIGEHFVTVSVKIDGVPYNKTVSFKVEY